LFGFILNRFFGSNEEIILFVISKQKAGMKSGQPGDFLISFIQRSNNIIGSVYRYAEYPINNKNQNSKEDKPKAQEYFIFRGRTGIFYIHFSGFEKINFWYSS
jgi:hypothetical protein